MLKNACGNDIEFFFKAVKTWNKNDSCKKTKEVKLPAYDVAVFIKPLK